MAGLAGGYAFYTIFAPKDDITGDLLVSYPHLTYSFLFGVIWGLIIYNIDRFIVTSTGKGDGTEKITWDELKSAIPRIIMGMIIAITISKPIEIRMFQQEIQTRLKEKQIEQQTKFIEKIKNNFQIELNRNASEISTFQNEIDQKIARYNYLEKQYIEEARIVKPGPKAEAIKAQMDNLGREIQNEKLNKEYLRLKKEKEDIQNRQNLELSNSKKVANNLNGLLERIKISEEVAGFWITLFITLLFMAIELTPIFFKLMLTKTPYDYLTENRDELIRAENGIEVKYEYYTDKKGIERHLVINHEAEKLVFERSKLAEIQRDLTEYALQKYKEREQKKIDENLDNFIFTDYKYGDTLNDKGEQGNDPLNSNA